MADMQEILQVLRAAAEGTRLRLLVLCAEGELTVSELTQITGQSQPRISRHLKLLVEGGLLDRFRHQIAARSVLGRLPPTSGVTFWEPAGGKMAPVGFQNWSKITLWAENVVWTLKNWILKEGLKKHETSMEKWLKNANNCVKTKNQKSCTT